MANSRIPGSEPVRRPPGATASRALRSYARGGYAYFGSVRVQRGIADAFVRAERYLSRDAEAVGILYRLERGATVVTVRATGDGNDRFDANTGGIEWDPHSALRTAAGGRQSPALGLLHEEDHAYARETAPVRTDRELATSDGVYDNEEEERVIRGVERRAALRLHEGVRHDHRGTLYDVKDPAVCRVSFV